MRLYIKKGNIINKVHSIELSINIEGIIKD